MTTLKKLESLFTSGKINRRQFLAQVAALGLTAAISPALFSSTARAAAPKKGGRLRFGCTGGSTTDSLDPGLLTSNMNQFINYMHRNALVEINHNFEPIPELAVSWESTPDAKVWTFELRKGVEFHNGKSFEAEDVVQSIQHHLKEGSKSAAKSLLTSIKEIKADGKHRVTFTLEGGSADFPFTISSPSLIFTSRNPILLLRTSTTFPFSSFNVKTSVYKLGNSDDHSFGFSTLSFISAKGTLSR